MQYKYLLLYCALLGVGAAQVNRVRTRDDPSLKWKTDKQTCMQKAVQYESDHPSLVADLMACYTESVEDVSSRTGDVEECDDIAEISKMMAARATTKPYARFRPEEVEKIIRSTMESCYRECRKNP
ncbi:MAG: hypothetical protein J3R72DRAFT_443879 [Linnemannia gamsii]|nr:MAG: hypothetical protein J3R72DRAFT_443879 [Linnemannia gamsii]